MTDGERLVQLINAQPNFPDRQIDPYLMELAQKRALEIQTAPNHRPLLELAPATDFGEVLAWNQWYPDPVERFVVGSWTRSDSHRQLLENPDYKYIGAGVTHYGDHQSAGCAIVKVAPVEEPVTADLDRFYQLLTERTGIPRKIDRRLEFAARFRSQQAVTQVGHDASGGGIPHPSQDERQARLGWPASQGAVAELAIWGYLLADPVKWAVDGLMASQPHREVLLNQRGTFPYWGVGHHVIWKSGDEKTALNARHYWLIWLATGVPAVKAIIVNGTATADALAASYLVSKYASPELFVTKDAIPPETHDELSRRKAANTLSEILVVGGTGVVSDNVVAALSGFAPTRRIAGLNRFSTAAAVSNS